MSQPTVNLAKEAAFRSWRKVIYHLAGHAEARNQLQEQLGTSLHLKDFQDSLLAYLATDAERDPMSALRMHDFERWLKSRCPDHSLNDQ